MTADLNNHHRDTVEKIFRHPSGNVEWREVLSLLEAVGDVVEEHNGKFKVTLGSETEVLRRPHGKDVDVRRSSTCGGCSSRPGWALAPGRPCPTSSRATTATGAGASRPDEAARRQRLCSGDASWRSPAGPPQRFRKRP